MGTANRKRGYGNGSVYFRESDQRWVGKYKIGTKPDGKPDVKVVYGKTEAECHKKLRAVIEEANKSEYVYVKKETVELYMLQWLNTVKKLDLKEKSFDRLEQTILYDVVPAIGSIQVGALTSDDVQKMIADMKDAGRSLSSIKKAYDAVNAAYKWGLLSQPPKVKLNPALGVKTPSKKQFVQKTPPFYKEDEAKALVNKAMSCWGNGKRRYPIGAFVPLLINTGLRMGELLGLQWARDIDLTAKTISVRTNMAIVKDRSKDAKKKYKYIEQDSIKTEAGQDRPISLNDEAYNALLDIQKLTGNKKYVMTTSNGTLIKPRQLDQMFRRIATAAGIDKEKIYGVHSLRHTFATLLLYNGVDIKTVSKLLGHSDVMITYNTYIHVIKDMERKALESIPSLSGQPKTENKES